MPLLVVMQRLVGPRIDNPCDFDPFCESHLMPNVNSCRCSSGWSCLLATTSQRAQTAAFRPMLQANVLQVLPHLFFWV